MNPTNGTTANLPPTPHEPDWVGPQAFTARQGAAGIDRDFGMRWGERRDQRISLRLPLGADQGLLYAYDPSWDKYAVLAQRVTEAAATAAFRQAMDIDTHMHVLEFAELVRCHQLLQIPRPRPTFDTAPVMHR